MNVRQSYRAGRPCSLEDAGGQPVHVAAAVALPAIDDACRITGTSIFVESELMIGARGL